MGLVDDAQALRNRNEALKYACSVLVENGFRAGSLQIVEALPHAIKSLIDEALPYLDFDHPFVVKTFSFPEFGKYTFAREVPINTTTRIEDIEDIRFACVIDTFKTRFLFFDDGSVAFLHIWETDGWGGREYHYESYDYFPERQVIDQRVKQEGLRQKLEEAIIASGFKPNQENLLDSRKRKINVIKQKVERLKKEEAEKERQIEAERQRSREERERKEQRDKIIKIISWPAAILLALAMPVLGSVAGWWFLGHYVDWYEEGTGADVASRVLFVFLALISIGLYSH